MQEVILKVFFFFILVLSLLFLLFYFFIFPRIIFYLLKEIKRPTKKDRILVFAPHPDDESLGCFGFISKAIKIGAKVKVVVLTDGHFLSSPEKRYSETLQTLTEAGLSKKDVSFLGFKVLGLSKVDFCSEVMKDIILSFKPTIIFSTTKYDSNVDHRFAYFHLKEALGNIKLKPKIYQYLIHYRSKIYPFPRGFKPNSFLGPPVGLINSKNDWFKLSLTDEELVLKNKAIMNYKSQLRMSLFISRKTLLSFIRRNELFFEEKD